MLTPAPKSISRKPKIASNTGRKRSSKSIEITTTQNKNNIIVKGLIIYKIRGKIQLNIQYWIMMKDDITVT